ncbi:MAG TPA: MazG-like family protein [Thermoplasmataceae archaeon]|nr:MazG-like family protein [Thermoplasmataceae archaeon]
MDLEDLKARITDFIDKRDWRQFQTTKDLAESASVESNELLELFIWRNGREMDEHLRSEEGNDMLENVKNETSDVLFACLAIAEHLGFSLEDAFLTKLKELDERYAVEKVKGKVVKIPSKK